MDVSSIFSLLQQHWLEITIILAIVFILRNLKYFIIAGIIFLGMSYFGISLTDVIKAIFEVLSSHGILDSIKEHIFGSSGGLPLNLLNDLINNSVNSTNLSGGG